MFSFIIIYGIIVPISKLGGVNNEKQIIQNSKYRYVDICLGIIYSNRCEVDVVNENKAVSTLKNATFEYTANNGRFYVSRNGNKVAALNTGDNVKLKQCVNIPQCNGVIVAGQAIAGATVTAGGAATTVFGAATTVGAAAATLPTTAEIALLGLTGAMAAVGTVALVATGVGAVLG